nr:HD domain-containing protein [Eubacterium sp.]
MKNITNRIFLVVFFAAVISVGCLFFLFVYQEKTVNKYNALVDGYIENRRLMSEISQKMYELQARVASHVVTDDADTLERSEANIMEINDEITGLFQQMKKRLTDDDEKEIFREVTKSYNALEEQVKVALKFSGQGAEESAEYYICEIMDSYIQKSNEAFDGYYERMKKNVSFEKQRLNEEMQRIVLWRNVSFAFVVVVIGTCLLIVHRSGQRIVDDQKRETDQHNTHIMDMQYKTIVGMANLIESRDGETGEHVKRTSAYAVMIANELMAQGVYPDDITKEYMDNLWKAAPLHDIGKIVVSDSILQKPGKLTTEEFDRIKLHASEGGKIIDGTLEAIDDKEYLDMAHQVARYHHEKWDGSGYPEGLRGEEIPLCARIMAVADVFDALISKRCYKDAMSVEKAYEIIRESSGSHFDPTVAEAFVRIRPQVEAYLREEDEDEGIRFK